jgi:hypothetical protein
MPWYYKTEDTGILLKPVLDIVYDESLWPRHITRFSEMKKFLFQIDWLYHSHCLDDIIKIVDCPRLGNGHLMMVARVPVSKKQVMKKVFGILEHYESHDFNVLMGNKVTSLFQNKTMEMYGEGSMLGFLGFYINTGPNAPFIWTDMRKTTKTNVSKSTKVIINVPILDKSETAYLELGQPLSRPFDEWSYYDHIIFDGVILKCKGNENDMFQSEEEITVDYNFGRGRSDEDNMFVQYNSVEAFRIVTANKTCERGMRRADKITGISKRALAKAKKDQEDAEKKDNEVRRREKKEKNAALLQEFEEVQSQVDTEEFFEDLSFASDSTTSYGEDIKRSHDWRRKQVTSTDHERWKTVYDFVNSDEERVMYKKEIQSANITETKRDEKTRKRKSNRIN